MNHNATQEAFRGAVQAALGHAPEVIEPGRLHRFSTSGRRNDDAGWCKLFADMRGGAFGCHRQGLSEIWSATDQAALTPKQQAELARQRIGAVVQREAQQRTRWAENARRIAQLWEQCVALTSGDPVARYLVQRGFDCVPQVPSVLRFHRALPYWHGAIQLGTFPAMVAPIVAPDGCIVALHRTYLADDGHKADVPNVKKLTGAAGPLSGACIPLFRPAGGCIGIAEGIETALAAWCASGVPTVAAYCAANLAAWQWPRSVRRLVIFADADRAGLEAAGALSGRARAARLSVETMTPSDPGADWCDLWASRDAVRSTYGGAA